MAEQMPSEQSIFLAAVDKPSAAERAAYLDHACAGNATLRTEIEALLAAHERLPAGRAAAQDQTSLNPPLTFTPPGTMIGRYKLLEPIGEGGYGTVFMAEQTSPVHRKVALKIIKAGMDTRQVIARFEAERQALALMDHPNIAKVFDAGVTDTGRPYFVMELVKGVPITKYCDEHHLTPRDRLELFVHVCQAVQHAHQKGIIHRDLKPSNVLVAMYDGVPVPKVIDFGVAKATGQQLTERTMFTGFGDVIGTLEYMSPEQAEINQLDIDTRSDIYSLGVLLYELLTGSTPLEHKRVMKAAMLEMLRVIREEEPPKPSTRLSTSEGLPSIAANRGLEPKKLSGLVHGELDWIVMKALEKDRSRRYETATGFARDIERYLHDEAVQACPPSARYRLRKFARRHRTGLLATAAAFVVLVVLVVGLSISNRVIARERNQKAAALVMAEAERQRAEKNFLQARQAVAKILAQPAAGMGEWSQLPVPLRKKFSEEAANYYQGLLQEGSADPSLRNETAVGYRSIAFLNLHLREYQQAEKYILQSILILDPLVREHPQVQEHRLQLAWSSVILGWTLESTARPAEAAEAQQRALELYDKLLSEIPDDPHYLAERKQAYLALMRIYPRLIGETLKRDDHKVESLIQRYRAAHEQRAAKIATPAERAKSYYELATFLIRLGRFVDAATAQRRALELDPTDQGGWYRAAVLYLTVGDVDSYRQACRQMIDRFCQGDAIPPHIAEQTAKTCSLASGAVADFNRVEKLADAAVTGTETHGYHRLFVLAKGLTEFRAGQPAQAVRWLEEFSPNPDGVHWDATGFAVLAMAQQRADRAEQARAALDSARKIIDQKMPDPTKDRLFGDGDWHDWLHCQILTREAEQVLKESAATRKSDGKIEKSGR